MYNRYFASISTKCMQFYYEEAKLVIRVFCTGKPLQAQPNNYV